jgi:hypothetical protein
VGGLRPPHRTGRASGLPFVLARLDLYERPWPMLTIQEAIKQFGFEEGRVINTRMSSCPNAALVSARKPKSNAPFNGVRIRAILRQSASAGANPSPTGLIEAHIGRREVSRLSDFGRARRSRKLAGIRVERGHAASFARNLDPVPQVVSKETSSFLKFATSEAVERSSNSFHATTRGFGPRN